MVKLSVYAEGRREIDRHKWIQSEKAGRDVGEVAIFEWINYHWKGYLRARWLEHLQGKAFWIELDRGTFGLLTTHFQDQQQLLAIIVDRLKAGQENLDIIWWGLDSQYPMTQIRAILEALDVNSTRLNFRFDCEHQ